MLNPFSPDQNPDPSGFLAASNLRKRLLKNIHAARVNDRIFQALQDAFEEALKKEHLVVMPDIAKKYLLAQIMKQVLMDMVNKLTNRKAI
jgi:hypothetical protein